MKNSRIFHTIIANSKTKKTGYKAGFFRFQSVIIRSASSLPGPLEDSPKTFGPDRHIHLANPVLHFVNTEAQQAIIQSFTQCFQVHNLKIYPFH